MGEHIAQIIREEGAKEDICAQDGKGIRDLEEIVQWGASWSELFTRNYSNNQIKNSEMGGVKNMWVADERSA